MKILISPLDSYLGRALYRYFAKEKKREKHEIIGTFMDEANPQFKPNSVTRWVSVCRLLHCFNNSTWYSFSLFVSSSHHALMNTSKQSSIVMHIFLNWRINLMMHKLHSISLLRLKFVKKRHTLFCHHLCLGQKQKRIKLFSSLSHYCSHSHFFLIFFYRIRMMRASLYLHLLKKIVESAALISTIVKQFVLNDLLLIKTAFIATDSTHSS